MVNIFSVKSYKDIKESCVNLPKFSWEIELDFREKYETLYCFLVLIYMGIILSNRYLEFFIKNFRDNFVLYFFSLISHDLGPLNVLWQCGKIPFTITINKKSLVKLELSRKVSSMFSCDLLMFLTFCKKICVNLALLRLVENLKNPDNCPGCTVL